MPHVTVKLATGYSEEDKLALVEKIQEAVTSTVNNKLDSLSIKIEEIPMENWKEEVYDPVIMSGPGKLYKKPGYSL